MTVEWPKGELGRVHAYSPLSLSLSPPLLLFPFASPPLLRCIDPHRGPMKKGWEGKPGHGYARCFPCPGIRIFSLPRETSTLQAHWLTWCALVYSKYTPRRNSGASEWWYARVSSKTDDASPRLLFSFFIYLETGLDRFPPTFSKCTHEFRISHCTRATKSDPFVSIVEPDAKYFATNVIPVSIFNAHA